MIAGACIQCGKIDQQYRKDVTHCGRCGALLTLISVWQDEQGRVNTKLASEEA